MDISLKKFSFGFPQFLVENVEIIWLRKGGDPIFRPATNGQALPIYPPTEAS
jgi:hypothetical protein